MVSKNEIKLITSLTHKKYRYKHLLFVAEGKKLVSELLNSKYEVYKIYTTENQEIKVNKDQIKLISEKEMQKLTKLSSASTVLGLFKIPDFNGIISDGIQLVLDEIKDPGNLGTIIRLCDWFGVSQLVCSPDTVDCYNPKVVQGTMGSLANVNVAYLDLKTYLTDNELPKYFTLLKGNNIYQEALSKDAIIVMGNEANGIKESLHDLADYNITIPKMGKNTKAESLNVAMATAIVLSEFKR